MRKWIWTPVMAAALCGCFKTKDELTLNADGSGSVRIETQMLVPAETLQMFGFGMHGDDDPPTIYPPSSEEEAKRWFPPSDFAVVMSENNDADGSRLVLTATFKDVNALLRSPYAKAHGLTLTLTNGVLSLKAVLGIEAAARMAEMKEEDMAMYGERMPGLDDFKKKKDEMRAEFRVTLPNAVTSASAGGSREGGTVTWILDRAKQTNAVEFSRQAGALLEASCPAEGVKFSPVTPARLSMLSFAEAPAGVVTGGAGPDTNKVVAAAKFVPCALQVTRTLDLSGEGHHGQNQAQLVGAVILPREFAPQKWSEPKLDEVVDAKGASLKFPQEEGEFGNMRRFSHRRYTSHESADEGEDEKDDAAGAEHRHMVTLSFQPPDWKVKEIARIKGSVQAQYYSGAQVVKISNAIPANWIKVMKSEQDFDFDMAQKSISDPKLAESGLVLKLTMGMSQGPMTSLMFDTSGSKGSVADAQIYDADGRPWPTLFMRQGFGGDDGVTLMVAGKPKAPLSLALVASGAGASVNVPILVEKAPVGAK